MRRLLSLLVLGLLLLSSGCSSGDSGDENAAAKNDESKRDKHCVVEPANEAAAGDGETTTFADGKGDGLDAVKVTGAEGGQPMLEFDRPFTIDETSTKVLRPGEGPTIEEGQDSLVDYVGVNGRDCREFDSSWSRGQTVPFSLVRGQMIEGFVDGLVGQKVGSRVLVAIPSAAGYPEGNEAAGIKQGDDLLFVVDIHSATTPLPMAEGEPVEPAPDMPTVETNKKGEPSKIVAPDAKPPAELTAEPLIKGAGEEVTEESTVKVHYLASVWDTGEVFDNSWQPPQEGVPASPATLPLAQLSEQAPGLVKGLIGQTVGSRVMVVMGAEEVIADPEARQQLQLADDATVIFVIDILSAL